jgi:radical SAM superfamily enzyme YgiQ (UPF0313 family)
MRVLLLNSNLKGDILAAPPIGLCYVASAAEKAGHEVQVVDLCFQRRHEKKLKEAISQFAPEVIGLSVRNIDNVNMLYPVYYLPLAKSIVDYIRTLTSAPIVVGGPAASIYPQGLLEFLGVDYVVVSDGEETFVELLQSIKNGAHPGDVPGVCVKVDETFEFEPRRMAEFPDIRPNLGQWIDMKPYHRIGSSYTVQTKRGCRHRCIYCVYHMVQGNKIRMRSPEEVVAELEEAHFKFGISHFEFVDSIFNDPPEHAAQILELLCKQPWSADFSAIGMDPGYLDDEVLGLMWRAGFRSFMMSPESMSETVLRNYCKAFTIPDVIRATERINKTRLTTFWYFLVGGPGETNQTLQDTLDFIVKYLKHEQHPPYHNINMFLGVRIYLRTRLWEIAKSEGLVNSNTNPLEPCWYVSPELNLDLAAEQMIRTAASCPELYLGFDERILGLSGLVALIGRLSGMPRPYWRHIWGINRLMLKFGLRFNLEAPDMVSLIRQQLAYQSR